MSGLGRLAERGRRLLQAAAQRVIDAADQAAPQRVIEAGERARGGVENEPPASGISVDRLDAALARLRAEGPAPESAQAHSETPPGDAA